MKISARHLIRVLPFVLVLLMWWYYAHSRQLIEQRLNAIGFPQRNVSDLFPRWLGTRELLLHGRDPYSSEITREIQQGYYGRPIDHTRPSDRIDEQCFAYPLFVVFLLAPTVTLPFIVVKWLFTAILSVSAAWTVLLWIKVIGLKAGRDKILACILLALATIPYGIDAKWSATSLALYTQAVIQGAFILAKAKHGPGVAVDCLNHLRRYLEMLFTQYRPKENRKRMLRERQKSM